MEFGSDYHIVDNLYQLNGNTFAESWLEANFYANGRQAINALIRYRGWSRIWMPRYFCYEIIASIAKTGIEIAFYEDYPLTDDRAAISQIRFTSTDVLLRMNYFGLRGWRDSSSLGVEVIEDHSHDLTGDWVDRSNATWCVASLRKSLPISEGGALWSPQNRELPPKPLQTVQNERLSKERWEAMRLKKRYLAGDNIDKDSFRRLYIQTELDFDDLPLSAMAEDDYKVVASIDTENWNAIKKRNWAMLNASVGSKLEALQPENDKCVPFSFVIHGQKLRQRLVNESIYPAVLWPISAEYNQDLLSIHCDGRYSVRDIELMTQKIEECLR